MVTREYEGIAGEGGIKNVARSLSEALQRIGIRVSVFLPAYGFLDLEALGFSRSPFSLSIDMNYANEERREQVSFWEGDFNEIRLILIESPRFSEKLGVYTYTAQEELKEPWKRKGQGHFDYFAMNILLQKAVLAYSACYGQRPDCIHCHDGHTALIPVLMRELEGYRYIFKDTGAIITIHNAGIGYHQDVRDLPFAKAITGLPWKIIHGSLLNGSFDPFLASAPYAPLNTVSENYARELQETDLDSLTGWLGHTLKERGIALKGITNGINPRAFDPKRPEGIGLPKAFDPMKGDLEGKRAARKRLCELAYKASFPGIEISGGLSLRWDVPLLTFIGRLTEQKGIDCLCGALEDLMTQDYGFQCVVLGTGQRAMEERLKRLSGQPALEGRLLALFGYSERLANLIYAAGDFFLMPSLFEPCGLTDFIAQLMGNIPIVRRTGGLVKVRDGFNGFAYDEHSPRALSTAMARAIDCYYNKPDLLDKIRKNAIQDIYENHTWDKVAKRYLELYRGAAAIKIS